MKTGNFPRKFIEDGRVIEMTERDWLISITDRHGEDANVWFPFERILYMKFDDVSDQRNRNSIDGQQSLEIANFIAEARCQQKNVWANCHAGICRSGAVVSLMIDLGWEDAKNPGSPGRIPNTLVYNEIRKHFPEVRHSWDPPSKLIKT